MAKVMTPEAVATETEKRKLKEEKKRIKRDQKAQRKEVKRRAAEIARQEEELGEEGSNPLVTIGATLLIIVLWLAVICIIVKLDIGGFGSSVLTPILKDVPVVNKILPGQTITETADPESYGGYSSLREAVAYIKELEQQMQRLQDSSNVKDADIEALKAEIERLSEFEEAQVEFQRIYTQFYEQVVNSEKGSGAEEYIKWYEEMNPTTAEYIYKQVLIQQQAGESIQSYAQTYAEMKPKQAAALFEEMTDNLDLVAKILGAMNAEDRADIFNAMDSEVAAKLTKIMDPDA